jgi:hypothetical protein
LVIVSPCVPCRVVLDQTLLAQRNLTISSKLRYDRLFYQLSTIMSTQISFMEGQFDALVNSMWWNLDEKYGRTSHSNNPNPNLLTPFLNTLRHAWDTLLLRLTLVFVAPYILGLFTVIEDPFYVGLKLVTFGLLWPWIYRIFIYNMFLDPLRHLPGPKVSFQNPAYSGSLVIRPRSRNPK